jgi:hypothetical protein
MRSLPGLLLTMTVLLGGTSSAAHAATQSADEVQREFDAALRAIEADRLRTAREKLTALLAGNPSLQRARLELARVHYLAEDYSAARAEAQRVLDDPETPPGVRTTVLAFLAQISEDEKQYARRHRWTPSIYLGLMYDDNVNIGPSDDVVNIGPNQFFVTPESQPREDFAWVVNPALSHVYDPGWRFRAGEHDGRGLWQTDLSAYYRGYFDETDFNLGVLTLRTGPAWVVPRKWRAWLGFQADQIWFGGDNLALFLGVNPGITWQLGQRWELTLDGSLTERDYRDSDNDGRDGRAGRAGATLTRYFDDRRWALQAGVGYEAFDTDSDLAADDRFSYESPQAHLGVIAEAWTNGVIFARVGYANYDFDGTEPLTTISRDDDELRYAAGFEHRFRSGMLQNWALSGSWTFTDNDSNVAIYEYDRHVVNLGLSRSF